MQRKSNKLIPYYIINIIYKPVKPSHFKKLQTIQNIKTLMFESHLHISERTLIKQIMVSYTPPYCWGKQIFERMLPKGMSNFLLPGVWYDDKNLGTSFEWGEAWEKMPQINAFSRDVNSINLKLFSTHCRI